MKTRIDKFDIERAFIDALYESNDETFCDVDDAMCDYIYVLRNNDSTYEYQYETNENEMMFIICEFQSQNEYIVAYDKQLTQITYMKQHSFLNEHL